MDENENTSKWGKGLDEADFFFLLMESRIIQAS